VAVLGACGSSTSTGSTVPVTSAPTPSATTPAPLPSGGYGLSRADFDRGHTAHYSGVRVKNGVVVGFTRRFAPAKAQVPALDVLTDHDLPSGAVVTAQEPEGSCESAVVRIPASATPHGTERHVDIRLYSHGSSYRPTAVARAVVSEAGGSGLAAC
jgi:hypothetical protein